MKRAERAWASAAAAALAGVCLVLTGCGVEQERIMNSDKAREQLTVAAEAVQSATGADWEPMTDVGPIGCSPGLERMKPSWKGVATADRDAGYAAVREALEEVGFETRILGPNSTTPAVASQTVDGFGLEEWPDEEG